jgi:hypothetical protein
MKTVIIICEGETEEEFCKGLLSVYLQSLYNINIRVRILHGNCNWERIKNIAEKALKEEKNAFVTTFFDYYGVKRKNFPNWSETLTFNKANVKQRIEVLEKGMLEAIDNELSYRFIPYIQMHEFEAFLFNNIEIFDDNFKQDEFNRVELLNILNKYPEPELINQKRETSPSHRLIKIIPSYNKIVYGNILVEMIGIEQIRQKNQHFDNWIEQLIK